MKKVIAIVGIVLVAGLSSILVWRQQKGTEVRLSPGSTFAWYKGTTLTAMESAVIVLPGEILPEDTPIGQIIQANDDDMQIGLPPKQGSSGFESVILKFKTGQSVTLGRSSDAMLVNEENQPKRFQKKGR